MTPPREPPSYVHDAIEFASAGSATGLLLGVSLGAQLKPVGAAGNSLIYEWALPGILGGAVAGFALGLTYAFLRRPADSREPEE